MLSIINRCWAVEAIALRGSDLTFGGTYSAHQPKEPRAV